jgi:uncharacterized protein
MSDPFKLYRLQQTDSQLDKARARMAAIEAALSDDLALRLAQVRLENCQHALKQREKELSQAESAVHDQRIKIEQTEATLYGGKVRNPKEMQDLQHEAQALKRYLQVLEDRQLDIMITVEDAENTQNQARTELQEAQKVYDLAHASLIDEKTALLRDIAHLENEREAILSSISSEDAALYTQVRQQRRGIAVAKVTGKACSACGSVLSASLLHAAHSPSQITRCDTCGRILYQG